MKALIQKLGVSAAMLLTFLSASADGFEVEGIYYSVISLQDLTCSVVGAKCDIPEIVIPAEVKYNNSTLSVTEIAMYAFWGCHSLTSIQIPNSITKIGHDAFQSCFSLTTIEIPNSVTSIEHSAFTGCSSLAYIEIPNSVTSIESSTFNGCSSLAYIEIPNSVTSIGNSAFYGCSSLAYIEIPNSVTSIGRCAFEDCPSLTSIEIPNSVTSIGCYAFKYCPSLTSIEIPNSVTSIGRCAFEDCTSITSVKLSNQLKRIEYGLFDGCKNLQSVTIPGSVTEIEQYAYTKDKRDPTFQNLNTLILEYSESPLVSGYKYFKYNEGGFYSEEGFYKTSWETWTNSLKFVTFDRAMKYDMLLPNLKKLTLGEHIEKVQVSGISSCNKLEAIECRSLTPPSVKEFSNAQYLNTQVSVPDKALESYKQHPVWGKFWNLAGGATTGENNISVNSTEIKEIGRYDLYGRSVSEDYQGMVIIRYSDGSTSKVFAK